MKSLVSCMSLLCLTIASCSLTRQIPEDPPIDFDSSFLNRQIRLTVVRQLSAFSTHDPVAVLLEYDTTNEIVFPSNFGLRLFSQQDGKWAEIKEQLTIRPKEPIILSPTIPSSHSQIVTFWPQLDDPTKEYYIRLYVFGTMKTPDGPKQVAAFVDFVLTP